MRVLMREDATVEVGELSAELCAGRVYDVRVDLARDFISNGTAEASDAPRHEALRWRREAPIMAVYKQAAQASEANSDDVVARLKAIAEEYEVDIGRKTAEASIRACLEEAGVDVDAELAGDE